MTTTSINHKEVFATHQEWCEADKIMRQRHKEEIADLGKHYKKLIHAITFPKRKK